MATKTETVADEITIRFKDAPFHLKNFYKMLYFWLGEHDFLKKEISSEKEMEKFYFEKRNEAGSEIWWWWRTTDVPDKSEFFRYRLNIDAHVLGLKKAEVVVNNRKVSTNIGEVEIKISAYLDIDPKEKWKQSGFLKVLFGILFKMKNKDIKDHFDELLSKTNNLAESIKNFFELPGKEGIELFHPEKGHY